MTTKRRTWVDFWILKRIEKDNCYTYILFLYTYTLFFIHVHSFFYTRTFLFWYTYTLSKVIRCSRNNYRFIWTDVASEKLIASHNAQFHLSSLFLFELILYNITMNLRSSLTDAMYLSLEDLIVTVNNHVESQDYAIVKQWIKKNLKIDQMIKTYLRCDREEKSKLKSHEQKRKHSFTRLVKCSFSCFVLNKISVSWILVVKDFNHNHSLIIEEAHFILRKLAIISETVSKIDYQSKTQATFAQILISMRLEDENCILKSRDIYNVKQSIRRNTFESLTSIQFLLQNLKRDNWYYKCRTTFFSHEITHLFFVEKHIFELLKNNWEVLLMNCIYKINKYKLSLLVIVDHIFLSITFYVDFAFLTKETEKNYTWVLETFQKYLREENIFISNVMITNRDLKLINVLHQIFFIVRHFLCVWHVNKNVLKHCKSDFSIKEKWEKFYSEWQTMIYAHSIEIYQEKWNKLQNDHYAKHFEIINYLKNIWIRSFDRKIIKCYINQIRHFFFTTISRFESAHQVLKHNLKFLIDDLKMMMNNIEILLMNQRKEYATKFDETKMRVSFDLKISSFKDLISHVISHALRMIFNQYVLIDQSNHSFVCTHFWIIVSNLSCSHWIKNRIRASTKILLLENVHQHWYFVKFIITSRIIDSLLLIQESTVARDRERSVKSIIKSSSQADLMKMMNEMMKDVMKEQIFSQTRREEISTQRNSSQFEMTENVVSSRKQASVRDRVVTQRRNRERERRRERNRERDRDRERDDRNDLSVSTEDVNEIIQ